MARSVMVPSNAEKVVYVPFDVDEEDLDIESDLFEDFVNEIQHVLKSRYRSLQECDRWVGREERAILENAYAEVVVSEYGGLVSISLCPTDEPCGDPESIALENLGASWCGQISEGFANLLNETFGGLRKIATASNGEAFFKRING